jgi:iron complex outermembrane receptor protein
MVPTMAFSQIKLLVLDENLKPLNRVVLQTQGPVVNQVTDKNGIFLIPLDRVDRALIQHVGYEEVLLESLVTGAYEIVLVPKVSQLGEVTVEGFGNDRALANVAGGIIKFSTVDLDRFDQQSLVRPLNLTPGIRFEERAGASYRVSIRGSSLRSPFGVRNVKVYWNGIPFTDAGGNTFLNLLDRQNMNGLEVIKGPAGSMFGAGTGGVMKFRSTNYAGLNNGIKAQISTGSFGFLRYGIEANKTTARSSWTAKFSHQESAGYRNHNSMRRNVVEIEGLLFAQEKRTIETSLLYTDLFYQIPGGLNRAQFEEDPRQARPRSADQNSSIDHQMVLFKLGQEYQFSSLWSNKTQLFGTYRQFENPFILDYKQDEETRAGLRSTFTFESSDSRWFAMAGLEYQLAWLDARNYGNVGGERDTIRFADELTNADLVTFINARYDFNPSWKLEFGLSLANTVYHINRTIDQINGNPQSFTKQFDTSLNPRIALSKQFSNYISAHFSISTGYSVPTTLEVRTNEGSLNTDLQPERGVNYEFNLRGGDEDLSFDLSLFQFDLTESITTFTNEDGVVLFRNAGSLRQQGAELEVLKPWFKDREGIFQGLSSRLSLTYHDFVFNEYLSGGDDFSGNALTGTAPLIVGFTTDARLNAGFYVNFSYLYTDEIPLNDENTVFANAYNMMFTKLGWRKEFKKIDADLSLSADNLLNEKYSLGNDLNAFGGRYFQPAPTRNYAINLILKLK